MDMSVKIQGDKQAIRTLSTLPRKIASKVIRKSMRDAMKLIQKEVAAQAPVGETGRLGKAAKVRAFKLKKRSKGVISITVVIGEGFFKGETFYAAFVQFGTQFQEAQDYMGRAFEAKGQQTADKALEFILAGVYREAR